MTFEEKLKKAADNAKKNRDFAPEKSTVTLSFEDKLKKSADAAKASRTKPDAQQANPGSADSIPVFTANLDKFREERKSYMDAATSGRNPLRINAYHEEIEVKPGKLDDVRAEQAKLWEKVQNGTATDDDYRRYVNVESAFDSGFTSVFENAPDYYVSSVVDSWDKYGIPESEIWKDEEAYKADADKFDVAYNEAFEKYAKGELSEAELTALGDEYKQLKAKEEVFFSPRWQNVGTTKTTETLKLERDNAAKAIDEAPKVFVADKAGEHSFLGGHFETDDKYQKPYDKASARYQSALDYEQLEKEAEESQKKIDEYKKSGFKLEPGELSGINVNNNSLDQVGISVAMVPNKVKYSNVDEYLKALASTIYNDPNAPGAYELMTIADYGTDDEKATYTYLRQTKGITEADKFARGLAHTIGTRAAAQSAEEYKNASNVERLLMGGISSIAAGLLGDNRYALEGIIKTVTGDTSYTPANVFQQVNAGHMSAEDNGIAKTAMQAVRSSAAQLPSMAVGLGGASKVATALFTARAYGSARNDAINQGYSELEADGYALVSAGLEYASEKLFDVAGIYGGTSLDDAVKASISKTIGNSVKLGNKTKTVLSTLAYLGLNGAGEAIEEGVVEFATPHVRNLIFGERNTLLDGEHIGEIGNAMLVGLVSAYISPASISTVSDAKANTSVWNVINGNNVTESQLNQIINNRDARSAFENYFGLKLSAVPDVAKAELKVVNSAVAGVRGKDGVGTYNYLDGFNISADSVMEYTEAVSDLLPDYDAEYVKAETDAVTEMLEAITPERISAARVIDGTASNADINDVAKSAEAKEYFAVQTGIQLSDVPSEARVQLREYINSRSAVDETVDKTVDKTENTVDTTGMTPSEAITAVAEESANTTVESLNADSERRNKKDSVTGITNTKSDDNANADTDVSTSDKANLLSKLDSIGKSKGTNYEVLSVDWAKNGHDRTYLKLREIGADGKPKTYDYGYFDNVSGEYVPSKYRDINELAKNITVNSENNVSDSANASVETVKTEVEDDRTRVYNDLISRGVIKNDDDGNYVFNQTYKYDANRSDANKTDFSIVVGNGRADGLHSETHSGTVIGGYGVSKSSDTGKYTVTHLQSGLSITSFDKKSDALQFASYVNDNVDYPIMRYRLGASVDRIYPTPADDVSKNAINKLKEIKDGDVFKKESNNNAVVSLPLTNKKDTFAFLKTQIGKDVLVNDEKRKLVSVSSKGFKTQNGSGDVITAEIAGNTLEYTDDGFVIKYSDNEKVKYQFPDEVSVDNGEDSGYNNDVQTIDEDVNTSGRQEIHDTGRIQTDSGNSGSDSELHGQSRLSGFEGVQEAHDQRTRRSVSEIRAKNRQRISQILKNLGISGVFGENTPRVSAKNKIPYQRFADISEKKGLKVIDYNGYSIAYSPVTNSELNDYFKSWAASVDDINLDVIFSKERIRMYYDGDVTSRVAMCLPTENLIAICTSGNYEGQDVGNHELFHWMYETHPDLADEFVDFLLSNITTESNKYLSEYISVLCDDYITGDLYTDENLDEMLEEISACFISSATSNNRTSQIFNLALSISPEEVTQKFNELVVRVKDSNKKVNSDISNDVLENKASNGDAKAYAISDYVMRKLTNGEKISSKELFSEAERAYGGTLADGVFTSKDAYDAMELGVNRYLLAQNDLTLEKVQKILDLLPTQTNRTDSQVALQQFSTPPTLAYLANYAANVRPGETMLEPSAGIGGIALFAKHDGAKVYVNEYDKRRLGVLKNMPFDGFFNEDAEQLDNILGDKVNPSVIVMNPPFSSSEKRGMKGTDIGAKHISEALKVLDDGGRLVAIVGQGMNDSAPAFRSWWKDIKEKYNVRANISIDGKLYKKYGTNFGIQMLVIDKTGKTDDTITGSVDNLKELEKILGGIRDARPETNNTDSGSRKQNSGTASRSEAIEGSELGLRRDTEASDNRNVSSAGGDTDAVGVQTGRTGRTDNKSAGTAETSSGENAGVQSDRRIPDKRQDDSRDGERRSSPEGNTSDDEGTRSRTVGNDNGLRDDTGPLEPDVGQSVQPVNERSESSRIKKTKKTELTDSIYEEYVPSKLPFKNAKKHPSKISESAAMSAIPSPVITYKPNLGDRVINDGVLSDVQLEAVCYAGQSHEQILEDGSRRGFFIGDGTGVGKGRTISGILLDNFNSGRKKAIWISMNDSLAKDASRDITALFGKDDMKFNFEGGKKAEKLKDTPNRIMFLTYGKLSQKFENDDSNFNRIVEWFGKDYDGVIVFDEAHKMANAEGKKGSRGMTKPSQTALAGIALQKALPKARIVYSSATGATDVRNLAYASRLGLWGKGTPFMNGTDFISKVTSGGIAAMELIARDLKSMGLYLSRNISYDGVKYEKLQHKLTKDQKQIYNTCAKAWQTVLQNVDKALKLTESNHKGGNRGNVQSAFWSSQQRFFNQIITSFQLPSVMDDIQKQLDEGKSCVVQLTSTNEAAQNREAERIKNDPELTLEDFDVSPKEMIIGFLEKSFPVEQYETQMDDRGNVKSVPVKDSNGNAVLNREAVKIRDDLIDKLGLLSIPSSPIDQLINHFGEEMVAENTGRSRRIITKDGEKVEQKLSQAKRDADVSAFQEGKKRIIVFSEAGGTGKSYHADRSANNQQQRIHYLLEAGWKADAAVQGFGRSHRSNQAITPVFKLVTTDLRGQMRFISTIAKRLDSLGAMTKGQRQAGSQGMFDASDNLENSLANDVLSRFYRDLASNRVDDIENGLDIIGKLGITKDILDEYGRIKDTSPVLREMNKFLNRILTLEYSEQNAVFDAFAERLAEANRQAEENGTAERGLENYRADSITIKQAEVIKTDENTGAETLYYNLTVKNRIKPKLFDDVNTSDKNFLGFYKNKNSGAVKAAYRTSDVTDAQGRVLHRYRLENPASSKEYVDMYRFYNWEKIDETKARSEWNEALKNLPEFKESKLHLISGVILPVWDKLPTDSPRIYRVLTDNGEMLIGRSVSESKIDEVLRRLGKNRTSDTYTSEQLTKELDSGNSIILDNGMNIKRRRVAGEWRYEISFGSSGSVSLLDDLKQKGVFSERVGGYVPRYFIPVNNISGILDYITSEISPVSRIIEGDDINKRASEYVAKNEATDRNVNEWSASRDEENKADVKSISDIIKDIRDKFDIPINTGNYRGSHLGQFNKRTESIRTRLANDLPTVSHELGHYLDKEYGLSKNESINEILDFVPADVARRYSKEQLPGEAIAEFVRRYLTSRESARVDAPDFFKDFENVLDSVGQLDFIKALASDVNAYMSSDLDVRYSKSIETAREAKRKTRGSISERVIEKAQSVYRIMVDDKADIKSALKSAGEYDESKGADNAYVLATNAANAYQRANSNLTFALSDIDGNIIGKSLVDRIMPVQKEIGAFNEYLKLKHALEWRRPNSKDMRAKQVFADPILDDPANIENQIKKFEAKYPHFKEVSEDVYDFIDNIMYEYGVKSGLESEEVYDHLKKIYPHYVPFYRADTKSRKAKGSFANQHSNFGYAKGSGLDTLPPLDNIVTLVNKVVASSVRNQAMNALTKVADAAEGFGNVMERVSPDMIRQTFDVTVQKNSLIDTLLENTDVDYNTLSDAINGVFDDTLNKFIPVAKGSKGIVTVRRGGANLYYQINDKDLYNAVASLSPTELKSFVKAASKINNFLKMGYTQYNPLFIVSNILRDFGTAWYNTDRNNFITYVGCYFQALKEGITQSEDFKRYMAMGGGRSSELNAEKKDLNKTFEKLMKAKNRNPVIKVFATVFNPSALNNLIEVTPRFMEFKRQLKETGDANTAMFKADDITTNFKRHGTNRSMNAVFMFSNAQIQGLDRLYRSFKDATPKQRTARIIKYCATALILEALLAWWNMKDDEEKESYENLSDYIKNNNYVVSVGDGRYIKIPKPREHAVLSSAVGRLAEWMFNGTDFDMVDFGGYIFDNLAPAFVPSDFSSPEAMLHSVLSNTFLGGIADVGFNLDYKGDPIVSAYDKYKDDRDQYSGGTSKVAVALGNALDYSPKKINYLIENYTGWFGSVLSSLAPMDESYKDQTLGFKGRYISDSRYSTDVFNDMYDNVRVAEKRVTDEERFADNHKASADAYAENETMQLLGDFTTQFRTSARNTLDTEEEKRDAYFFSQQYIKGYDYTESEGLKFAKSLFEETGDDSVFITEMPITYDDEYSKDKVKYGMNLTPEQYLKLTNEYYDGIEKIRVDLSKLNISPERKVEKFDKRKREFTTNLRRKYVDEYGSRISE